MFLNVLRGEARYLFLGTSLVAEIALLPHARGSVFEGGLIALVHTLILITAVYAISDSRRTLAIGIVLAAPSLLRAWWDLRPGVTPSAIAIGGLAMTAALYLYVAVVILRDIYRRDSITTDAVFGGICTYLLAGYLFAVLYMIVWMGNPAAFTADMASASGSPDGLKFGYFSFVTLTTLGYGDISPVDPRARSLAILEAITGVLFLATFISRLVSDRKASAHGRTE